VAHESFVGGVGIRMHESLIKVYPGSQRRQVIIGGVEEPSVGGVMIGTHKSLRRVYPG
jgi:hypothetical protein